MPNTEQRSSRGSDDAREWTLKMAGRIGAAVKHHRAREGLSAVQLSERTQRFGYPITRGTIARIEGNHRLGKLDIAELLVLARALDVPPALLLYPEMPDGKVDVLPAHTVKSERAANWLAGRNGIEEADLSTRGVPVIPKLKPGFRLMSLISRRRAKLLNRIMLKPMLQSQLENPDTDTDIDRVAENLLQLDLDIADIEAQIRDLGGVVDDA